MIVSKIKKLIFVCGNFNVSNDFDYVDNVDNVNNIDELDVKQKKLNLLFVD